MTASRIFTLAASFARDERGATAMEYGLILAGISVVIATATATVGTRLTGTFTTISTYLN